jgi:hypothetical protein
VCLITGKFIYDFILLNNIATKYLRDSPDGEFNSLRTMGSKRPISIIEVIRNAKAEARKMGAKTILKYFTLNPNGMYVNYPVLF